MTRPHPAPRGAFGAAVADRPAPSLARAQGGGPGVVAPTLDIGVIGGCGHVGLPLAIGLALRGHHVCLLDVNATARAKVARGVMPFAEEGAPEALRQALDAGHLRVASEEADLAEAEVVLLVVGTPVDGHLSPALAAIHEVLEQYRPHLRDGQLMVLRSTMYPGTAEGVWRWLQAQRLQIDLAVCPERIAQGAALREIAELPQIVAGFTPAAVDRAAVLFASLGCEIVQVGPKEAELAKLFANAWRYIRFAAANQFLMMAEDLGADFEEVFRAMTHNYPRAADLPRPGFAAGPCLFKDTMQLAASTNNRFFLGHAAMMANEGLPQYVTARLRGRYGLSGRTVGLLGMAFKAGVDDARDSLAYKLKALLELEGATVLCTDPYVDDPALLPLGAVVAAADVLVITTPHPCYRQAELGRAPVVDIWNFLGRGSRV